MTSGEALAVLKRITYKPLWVLRGHVEIETTSFRLQLRREDMPDVSGIVVGRNPAIMNDKSIHLNTLDGWTEDQFIDWVLWQVHLLEQHETHEWFMVDKKAFKDPHA